MARCRSRHHPAPAEHVWAGTGQLWPSDPHPSSARLDAAPGPAAAWTPGQRRVKEDRSLPSAPSPLESPRNDVSTRQLKKEFNYRDRLWELEQTRSVGGAGKQLRSERARLATAPQNPRPESGGWERPQKVGKAEEIRGIAFSFGGGDFLASPGRRGLVMVLWPVPQQRGKAAPPHPKKGHKGCGP